MNVDSPALVNVCAVGNAARAIGPAIRKALATAHTSKIPTESDLQLSPFTAARSRRLICSLHRSPLSIRRRTRDESRQSHAADATDDESPEAPEHVGRHPSLRGGSIRSVPLPPGSAGGKRHPFRAREYPKWPGRKGVCD